MTSVFDGDNTTAFDSGAGNDGSLHVGFMNEQFRIVKVEFINTGNSLDGADVIMGDEKDGQEWIHKYTLGRGENLIINVKQ